MRRDAPEYQCHPQTPSSSRPQSSSEPPASRGHTGRRWLMIAPPFRSAGSIHRQISAIGHCRRQMIRSPRASSRYESASELKKSKGEKKRKENENGNGKRSNTGRVSAETNIPISRAQYRDSIPRVRNGDLGPASSEIEGDRFADSARRAGDDGAVMEEEKEKMDLASF